MGKHLDLDDVCAGHPEAQQELLALRRVRDDWKLLAESLDKLCVAYRTGGRPSGKTLDDITKARAALLLAEQEGERD